MKASLMAVGFNFYLILARLIDVDPHMTESRLKCVISLTKSYLFTSHYLKLGPTQVCIEKFCQLEEIGGVQIFRYFCFSHQILERGMRAVSIF